MGEAAGDGEMNSVMAYDELDELYWVTPEKFTATRSTARRRGQGTGRC